MNTYRLSDKVLQNLLVFLGRIELKGHEVPAFNEIIAALSAPAGDDESSAASAAPANPPTA